MPHHDPQLIQWINDDLRLPVVVTPLEFEQAFANGELFCAILKQLAGRGKLTLPDGALDGLDTRQTTAAKLLNFSVLRTALAPLGISCGDKLVADIITEQRGAAASLVLAIKAGTSRDKRVRSSSRGPSVTATHNPSEQRASQYVPTSPEEKYAHHLLSGGMGHKQVAIELGLMPFEYARSERDRKVLYLELRSIEGLCSNTILCSLPPDRLKLKLLLKKQLR
jgi:hypothetical protein